MSERFSKNGAAFYRNTRYKGNGTSLDACPLWKMLDRRPLTSYSILVCQHVDIRESQPTRLPTYLLSNRPNRAARTMTWVPPLTCSRIAMTS